MGLSLVGAITGVVAWYQYSTRATASFIGTSVANTGLLQIGKKTGTNTYTWYRDLSGATLTETTNGNKLTPVTFGAIADGTIPGTAYMQPEAGTKRGDTDAYANWKHAKAGEEYLQFEVYLQAKKVANNATTGADELVEVPVYLSDITLADVTSGKLASEALRVHIAVDGETTSTFLISKTSQTQLPLYGNLDLDGDGEKDVVGGYQWEEGRNALLEYGKNGDTQTTKGISELVVARDESGNITGTDLANKKILTTKSTGPTKLTITIWLEGWHFYSGSNTAIWDGTKTANTNVNVGLTFDVGRNAFDEDTL
jgi:hypothetical protein